MVKVLGGNGTLSDNEKEEERLYHESGYCTDQLERVLDIFQYLSNFCKP